VSLESGIPDLLHRFVATPLTLSTGAGESLIHLETNDPVILDSFRSQLHNFPDSYTWKLIRDEVTSTGNEITVLVSGPLVMVLLGVETCVVVDHDCRRVLGFLASDVDAGKFLYRLSSILAESAVARHVSAR
jgi:hypothetical protein